MSYLGRRESADLSVGVHPYSTATGTTYIYTVPTVLGEGVTRPSTTTFTLAAGRNYFLIGSIAQGTSSAITIDTVFQFYDVTNATLIGKVGSNRATRSNAEGTYRKNPMRRAECVALIPSSYITGASITLRVERVSISNTSGLQSLVSSGNSEPCVIIISTPEARA